MGEAKYIGVKTRTNRRIIEVNISKEENINYQINDIVIIKTPEKIEDAKVIYFSNKRENKNGEKARIIKKANKEDLRIIAKIAKEETKASRIFAEKAAKHRLDMKLLKTEINFDEKHITFYFSAETRLDFRDFLKDLVRSFHKLIRLQQIGPRDEAKLISGFGPCGRELCCRTFLRKLETILPDLVKTQRLSQISSSKISGNCGKLMCCLAYENDLYQEMKKKLPEIGSQIKTAKGRGKVIDQDILNQRVTVELENGEKIEVDIKGGNSD